MTRTFDRRLAAGLMIGALSWAAPSAAALTVLVPAKLAMISPDDKVGQLALVTIVGSIGALVAAIGFGTLSDHTRGRFGRRAPWMTAGALASAGLLVVLSFADTVAGILFTWLAFQAAMNALIAPLKAVLADRVPPEQLGRMSSLYGAATLVGFGTGVATGSAFVSVPNLGLMAAAVIFLTLPLVSVVVIHDRPVPRHARGHGGVRSALAALAPPRGAPDFYWALGGRFGVMLGNSMITTFQLYILTDYAQLSLDTAGRFVAMGAVLNLVASVIGSLVSGFVSDRIGRRRSPVVAASIIIAVAMAFPLLVPAGWAMLVYATVAGLGIGIYFAVDVALMTEVLPNRSSHSRDLGILNVSNTGGQTLGPGISSLIVAAGVGFGPVFLVAMAVTVVGGFSTLFIRSVR